MPSVKVTSRSYSGERASREFNRKKSIPSFIRSLSPFRFDIAPLSIWNNKRSTTSVLSQSKNDSRSQLPPLPPSSSSKRIIQQHLEDKTPGNNDKPMSQNYQITRTLSDPLATAVTTYSSTDEQDSCNEEDLICPICLDILYRPRQLNCGHCFCLLCLQNYVASCWNTISCPSCRRRLTMPAAGVLTLPRSKKLEKAISTLRKKQEISYSMCQKCKNTPFLVECAHCYQKLCSNCQSQHLEEIRDHISRITESLEKTKETLLSRSEEQEEYFVKLKESIEEVIEKRIASLRLKGEKLQLEVKNRSCKSTDRAGGIIHKMEDFNRRLQEPPDIKNINDFNQLLREYNSIKSAALKKDQGVLLDTSSLSLRACISKTPLRPRRVRSFNDRLGPHTNQADNMLRECERVSTRPARTCCLKQKVKQKICVRPAGVAVCPWDENVYISGSGSCKIFICDKEGNKIGNFGFRSHSDGGFMCPSDLAFSQISDEILIIDKWKHCIQIFSSEGSFIRQIGREGKGFGHFCSPEGICTDAKGRIYVADTCNDRVQVLDSDGAFLHEIGAIASESYGHSMRYKNSEFQEPAGIAVNHDGSKVYVADSGNHRIKVFDGKTGHRLLVFGTKGKNQGQFETPDCISIDREGYIYVGDSGNGRVQIFKPNGQLVTVLGCKSKFEAGDLGWVSGITVTDQDEVFMTDFKHGFLTGYT